MLSTKLGQLSFLPTLEKPFSTIYTCIQPFHPITGPSLFSTYAQIYWNAQPFNKIYPTYMHNWYSLCILDCKHDHIYGSISTPKELHHVCIKNKMSNDLQFIPNLQVWSSCPLNVHALPLCNIFHVSSSRKGDPFKDGIFSTISFWKLSICVLQHHTKTSWPHSSLFHENGKPFSQHFSLVTIHL